MGAEYTAVMDESFLHGFIAFHPVATISTVSFVYNRADPLSALSAYDSVAISDQRGGTA
jgi:hypothetical protein